ncbi:MAG: serine/threonine protein kinase [Polyangiaceae bacterium]|jgi:serine/threonine-protein kinase|nr:serine/threonine protein kinase [Polyangiaceae bacterium]
MAAELKSGSTLGRYELLVRLGLGGMASVWVARERAPVSGKQRLVAVKAMLPELLRHSDFRAMFLEEGQIVRSIDHPHVVKVHEVSEDRGILYMAMEWVEGDSLRTIIKEARRRRAIPSEIAVKIIADAGAGLHAAHELRGWDGELRNIVHCDVSPHNILVGLDGHAKLVDFGVANATAHSDLGAEEKIKGKFGYMSPEQARAEKLDRRSDVFALGIVLFELLTGERLFRGENAAHSLELVKRGPIPNPADLNPKLSPQLAAIVQKSLERDVRRRYQTALELAEALERCLVEQRVLVSPASVGQLVRRVLGSRIETQRQALREALTASDGVLSAGLVPDHPAAPEYSHPNFSSAGFPISPSEPPTSSSLSSKSATPRPQSLELLPKRKSSLAPFAVAIIGLAAAGAAVWFANNQVGKPLPNSGADIGVHAATNGSKPSPSDYTQEPGPSGVNIDSIPLAPEEIAAAKARGAHPAKPGEAAAPPTEKPKAEKPEKTSDPKAPVEPEKELTPQKEPTEPPPTEPELPPAPTEKPPPPDQRTPLNRSSALTALSKAATSAASCKREGGPSGTGSASITFSPDGPVSSVSISAPFAGTPVGACVQTIFRSAHVPPFSGSAVTLSKSFRIPD